MNFHDQLFRYFGTSDIGAMTPEVLESGLDHMRVDFGLEKDPGRRFALWALMYMLGNAPDLDVAFKNEAEREAARNFMDMVAGAEEQS